ncbi:MAG: hypothetical protein RMN51_06285 [Verrucomicrobiota bacterium]|nr:hypothetical protein [Limisphaera sp.]MDW8381699.1 hypothetical protein [Verrucomicrobiota bacterium]
MNDTIRPSYRLYASAVSGGRAARRQQTRDHVINRHATSAQTGLAYGLAERTPVTIPATTRADGQSWFEREQGGQR